MSLQNARVQPQVAPPQRETPRAPQRRLRPLEAPEARRRPKLAGAILAVSGALAIGAAQMGLSLASTQDSFVVADLTAQQRSLTLEKQALQDELAGLSSPQSLASRADALGLVVAGSASYLRLSDGSVLGASEVSDWTSTVNPNGSNVVSNALLVPDPVPVTEEPPVTDETAVTDSTAQEGATAPSPTLPPAVTDGLPTPTTR